MALTKLTGHLHMLTLCSVPRDYGPALRLVYKKGLAAQKVSPSKRGRRRNKGK